MSLLDSPIEFWTLAQSSDLFGQVAPWLGVLVVVVIVGGVVIFAIRKQVFGDDGASSAGGFTLHDLRQLHAAGEMSDEEFERAREQMIGRLRKDASPEEEEPEPDAE